MGQCLKISEGTFCQKMDDSNTIIGLTISILMLDQFSRRRKMRLEQANLLDLEITVVQINTNFKFYKWFISKQL